MEGLAAITTAPFSRLTAYNRPSTNTIEAVHQTQPVDTFFRNQFAGFGVDASRQAVGEPIEVAVVV